MNLKDSLKAGISTIYNLMDEFTYENQTKGVKIIVRKWLSYDSETLRYSVLSRPKPGEFKNGDNFFVKQLPYYSFFSVIDGLGHGEEAETAAALALDCIKIFYSKPLDEIIQICDNHLKASRGAVISLCRVSIEKRELEYIGIGNVEMKIFGGITSKPFNWNGTVGMQMENTKVQKIPYTRGMTLVMYSDGIGDFQLDPSVQRGSPHVIGRHILENYALSTDDSTVLVVR